jgi:tetratricopeptide (TPR) repeat protein
MDLIKFVDHGIIKDEVYYIYLVQKVDPKTENLSQYFPAWDDPDNVFILINKGEAYGKEKKYSAAIEQFEKAIAINPKISKAYIDLSAAYGSLKQYQKSLDCLKKAQTLDSINPLIPYFFGLTYMNLGDSIKGNEYLKKSKLMRERQ